MAGTRLHQIGTIFSRVTGLLRSKALKEEDRPLWYDIYKAFPPKQEPNFTRPKPTNEIAKIFYKEDIIRSKFYKTFGSPGIIDMSNDSSNSLCQRFIDKYIELEKQDKYENLFEETVKSLSIEGVILVSRHAEKQEDYSDNYDAPITLSMEEFTDKYYKNPLA
ncbi:Mitochondrial ribosomal protein S23 [Chamberlinius hualienensis]